MPVPWHFPLLGSNACGARPPLQPVADGVAQLGAVDAEVEPVVASVVFVATSTEVTGMLAADVALESRLLSPPAITIPLMKTRSTSTATVTTIHQVLRELLGCTLPFAPAEGRLLLGPIGRRHSFVSTEGL